MQKRFFVDVNSSLPTLSVWLIRSHFRFHSSTSVVVIHTHMTEALTGEKFCRCEERKLVNACNFPTTSSCPAAVRRKMSQLASVAQLPGVVEWNAGFLRLTRARSRWDFHVFFFYCLRWSHTSLRQSSEMFIGKSRDVAKMCISTLEMAEASSPDEKCTSAKINAAHSSSSVCN